MRSAHHGGRPSLAVPIRDSHAPPQNLADRHVPFWNVAERKWVRLAANGTPSPLTAFASSLSVIIVRSAYFPDSQEETP